MSKRFWLLAGLVLLLACTVAQAGAQEVVVYTSVDRIFSEPIIQLFEKQTGIKVLAMYDVEATKTVGLVNRLIAEKGRPRADVFWNFEMIRTMQLVKEGVTAPYKSMHYDDFPEVFKDKDGLWTGFAGRARVLLYNANLMEEKDLPVSILDFVQPQWQGKVTIAYPLFGTTAMHMSALYAYLGAERTEAYLDGLVKNGVMVVDGNSVTRDLVVQGKAFIGFTDTDDAKGAIDKGAPVKMVFPDSKGMGTLLIPNTVALIKGGPNPENGKKFIDFLLSPEIEKNLAEGEAGMIPLRIGSSPPDFKAMDVDYVKVAEYMETAARFCQKTFVR